MDGSGKRSDQSPKKRTTDNKFDETPRTNVPRGSLGTNHTASGKGIANNDKMHMEH